MPGPDEKEPQKGANNAPEKPKEVILSCPSEKKIQCPSGSEFFGIGQSAATSWLTPSSNEYIAKSTAREEAEANLADKISLAADKAVYRCPKECGEKSGKTCRIEFKLQGNAEVTYLLMGINTRTKVEAWEARVVEKTGITIICKCSEN